MVTGLTSTPVLVQERERPRSAKERRNTVDTLKLQTLCSIKGVPRGAKERIIILKNSAQERHRAEKHSNHTNVTNPMFNVCFPLVEQSVETQ